MKKLLLIAILLTLTAAEAQAQAAGAFSRMGFGARGVAMSNALVADASGHASPYYNPALAPFIPRQSLDASAALMTLDRELQFLQFATPLRPRAGIAVGLIHAAVSDIDGRDGSGYHTQNFSTDEYALFMAFGVRVSRRVTVGLGLQFFRADYFEGLDPVNSIGLDLGFNVEVTEAFRLGLAVDDVLARYSWDTSGLLGSSGRSTSDRFPTRLRLGGAYYLLGRQLLLTAEYESRFTSSEVRTREVRLIGDTPREVFESERLTLHESRLRFGAEYQPVAAFAVRGGLDRLAADDFGGVRPSAGFMVEQALGSLVARAEYAFVLEPYALGTMHLVTLRFFL
ncbi:MAG: PorV/PorQ family protein [Bacteroidetes bacterium]|nr:PorV/PorQ family protein [Bacteroidota bacterium]